MRLWHAEESACDRGESDRKNQFFLRNELPENRNKLVDVCMMKQRVYTPSVSLVFPPVGWLSTAVHEGQTTTVCACEKMVVMLKQPEPTR